MQARQRKARLSSCSKLTRLMILCGCCFGLLYVQSQPNAADIGAEATPALEKNTHDSAAATTAVSTVCLDLQLDMTTSNRYRPNAATETSKCLLYEEPSPYVKLVQTMVMGTPNQGRCDRRSPNCKGILPYDEQQRYYGNDWPPFGYTMTGMARLENLRASINEVYRNKIPGSIVELGVWRGGAMILAAAMCTEQSATAIALDRPRRHVHLFDAFDLMGGYRRNSKYLANSLDDVRSNFQLFDVLDDEFVHFERGLFKDTLPAWKHRTDPIAVLRVDGNFYDSYQDAMYYLYEKVPVGGIVIFDDVMSHKEVMRFWVDFKKEQGLLEDLNRIDVHSAWFRKEKEIQIDFSKMHPPQDSNVE